MFAAATLLVSVHAVVNVPARLSSNAAVAKTFRRAEFWDQGSATLLDIVNVLGRWESAIEWAKRTEFMDASEVNSSDVTPASTRERYEMAQRLGQVERIALVQNSKKLQFRDEALAGALGLTSRDFQDLEINPVAVNIVFDALAQSKNSMLPPEVVDERRRLLLSPDGGLDELKFSLSLFKARLLVILSWLVFGKGNIIGALVLLKVVTDSFGGADFFQVVLERQDLVLLGLGTAAVMTTVGREQGA